jgi:hypothetical protein
MFTWDFVEYYRETKKLGEKRLIRVYATNEVSARKRASEISGVLEENLLLASIAEILEKPNEEGR